MAKPIKIWTGSEWVDIAIQAPSTSGLATTSALAAHEADTTNIHGITDTSQLANLASPNFTGTPTAPTATLGTNSTRISTTAFVSATIDNEELLVIAGAL